MTAYQMSERSGLTKNTIRDRLSILNRIWKDSNYRVDYPEKFYLEITNSKNFKTIDGKLYHISELEIIDQEIIYKYGVKK